MAQAMTSDQVVDAAKDLGKPEFTRLDIAEKLGVTKPDLQSGFKDARRSGRLEKVRDDADDNGVFKLKG
jgi:hypothetical protein